MTLTEKQKSLMETCISSAMEKWEGLLNDATGAGDNDHALAKMMREQIAEARELLHTLQDADTVSLVEGEAA